MSNKILDEVEKKSHSWLDEANDSALFGTGDLPLQDPTPSGEDESESTSPNKKANDNKKEDYGSVQKAASGEQSVISKASSAGSSRNSRTVLIQDEESQAFLTRSVQSDTFPPQRPRQNFCLWMFHLMEGATAIASLCLLITQILPLILIPITKWHTKIGIANVGLKVYISLFCILFILTELSAPVPFLKNSPLFQAYFSRGFLYSFMGLICIEEAYDEHVHDIMNNNAMLDTFHISWASIFMSVSSWFMFGMGILYMLMGICCMKRLRDRMKQNEKDAWTKYRKDTKEWIKNYGPM